MADPVRGVRGVAMGGRVKRESVSDIFSLSIALLIVGMFSGEVAIALASMELQALVFISLTILLTVENVLAASVEDGSRERFPFCWSPARLVSSWLR